MGNLIIAGALKDALCGFDFTSSVWLELQPAYPVARIAEFARLHFCHFYHLDHSAMSQQLQDDLQLCAGAGQLTPAWQSMVRRRSSFQRRVAWAEGTHMVACSDVRVRRPGRRCRVCSGQCFWQHVRLRAQRFDGVRMYVRGSWQRMPGFVCGRLV